MRICQVELIGFRGVRHGRIVLPTHTVLLGANNSGKTTIVESLALLFGRERMVRPVSDWDFYGGALKPETRFHIIATLTDFPADDPKMLPEWFVAQRAARPVWWHEDAETVSVEADPPDGTRLAAQVALTGRYDDETCEFEVARYFYDGYAIRLPTATAFSSRRSCGTSGFSSCRAAGNGTGSCHSAHPRC